MQFYLVLAVLFAISVAIFAVQNATLVDIHFFTMQFQSISLVIVIFVSLFFGAIIIFLLNLVKQITMKRRIGILEKRNEFLEKEIERIKPTPQLPGDPNKEKKI